MVEHILHQHQHQKIKIMIQYINKSAVVAEIKGYISNYKEIVAKTNRNDSTWVDSVSMIESKIGVLQHLLAFLNTLEVKEIGVDLGDPKGDVEVKTAWTDLEEVAIKYGNCFEKHSDLASMAFIKGAKWGKEQAEIQIKAQSMPLPHGCPKEKPISEELEEAANSCSSCIYLEEVLSDDDKEVLKERLVNTFKAGAQWQKEHLINKATEWLCYNYDKYIRVVGSSIYPAYAELCKDFQKAMKE